MYLHPACLLPDFSGIQQPVLPLREPNHHSASYSQQQLSLTQIAGMKSIFPIFSVSYGRFVCCVLGLVTFAPTRLFRLHMLPLTKSPWRIVRILKMLLTLVLGAFVRFSGYFSGFIYVYLLSISRPRSLTILSTCVYSSLLITTS